MKQPLWPDELDPIAVHDELSRAGINASPEAASVLTSHAMAVLGAAGWINLTGIREPERFVQLHIVDSAAIVADLALAPPGPAVDVGTGAGYPGVPLAVLTGRRFTLLDSTEKKARFLQETLEALDLTHVEVRAVRAEAFARERPGAYAAATARGVGRLATVVELAAPLLEQGGMLFAFKGSPDEAEMLQGDRAAALCGMRKVRVRRYGLPTGERRTLVVYERVGSPKIALPRRAGMANKRPLG